MRKQKTLLSVLLTLAMIVSLAIPGFAAETASPEEPEKDYSGWDTIQVFETTDVHGWMLDISSGVEDSFQYRLAYIAKLVDDARANEDIDDVLLLDGGDIYQAAPLSNLTYGAALRAAYDVMDYDAVALGNHEFDWDLTTYAVDEEGTMPAYEIGEFKGDSDIPVVTYNLQDASTGEPVSFLKDHVVVEKAGYKVAIVGYAEEYSKDIMTAKIAPYTIDDDLNHLADKAAEVKESEGADIVIILAHADPEHIAEAMDPDVVDLVCGGHTHTRTNGVAENTGIPYIQGYKEAQGYSTAEIMVNPETKEVDVVNPVFNYNTETDKKSDMFYDGGNNDKLDKDVEAISQAVYASQKDLLSEVLVTMTGDLTKDGIVENTTTSTAGTFLASLMLKATEEFDTVAAFTNSGGIRTTLERDEGADTRDLKVGDIYTITPFGNRLFTYTINGAQLAAQLENALQGSYDNSNFGDQFAGITATYYRTANGINVTSITTDDGQSIDPTDTTKTFNVVCNEYNATLPGSVFENLTPVQDINEAPVDNESAIAALRAIRESGVTTMDVDSTVRAVEQPAPEIATLTLGDGTVYYRLRDMAYAVKGTNDFFNVSWTPDEGIVITTGEAYEDEALPAAPGGSGTAGTITAMVNGQSTEIPVLNLANNNYVSAETLASLLNVEVPAA